MIQRQLNRIKSFARLSLFRKVCLHIMAGRMSCNPILEQSFMFITNKEGILRKDAFIDLWKQFDDSQKDGSFFFF